MNNFILKEVLKGFLTEDIGFSDITTESIIRKPVNIKADFKAKETLVLAGQEFIKMLFKIVDAEIYVKFNFSDGTLIESGTVIGSVEGDAATVLTVERTALNLLQRLSGIATLTRAMVESISGFKTVLVDTRKTTPGLRFFEKYATKVGGAVNHRAGLFDSVLIKDNHIKIAGSVGNAIKLARENVSFTTKIEVEAQNLSEVEEALASGADIILLDNMALTDIKESVNICRGKALTEASGGVSPDSIKKIAETGVDYISAGFITHHAVWKDINLKVV